MSTKLPEQQRLGINEISLAGAPTALILQPAAEGLLASSQRSDWLLDGVPIRMAICPDTTPPGVVCTGDLDWWLAEGLRHHFISVQVGGLEMRIDLASGLCELHAMQRYVYPREFDDPADALLEDEDETAEHGDAVPTSHIRWSAVLGHITVAGAAMSALREIDIAEGVRDEVVLVLESLSDHLTGRCLKAFAAGHHVVHARPNSVLAPFIPLPADAWHHLVVQDWEGGRLEGRSGETFYSACVVVPEERSASKSSTGAPSKGTSLATCRKRLAELIAASPNARTESKTSLRKKLVAEIDGLSARGFNMVWDQEIERLGARAWKQPGAISQDKP